MPPNDKAQIARSGRHHDELVSISRAAFSCSLNRLENRAIESINPQRSYFLLHPAQDSNIILPNMQANLFKLLAIAAPFSAVYSAPVETAEVVNGTQVNETQTNYSYKVAGVRALPRRSRKNSYDAFYRVSERLIPKLHLLRSSTTAIRGTFLISAKE